MRDSAFLLLAAVPRCLPDHAIRTAAQHRGNLRVSQDAIPIEVGKRYLIYMSDEYLASEGVYAEDGYSYLYEIDGNTVRYGMDALTDSRTPEELIAAVEAQIASRTGRADEIGSSQYIDELGKAQAAAQREQAE